MTTGDAHGVIFDVDSVLRVGSLRRQLGRLRALRTTSLRDRRSMLAMPRLVRALSADLDGAPVFYLTAFPTCWPGRSRRCSNVTAIRRARC